jgi:ferredoxin-thioredoxin reductase catalytic subunit
MEKTIDGIRQFVERAAHYYGWQVTGDREFLDSLIQGLLTNLDRYGLLSCPCRDSWGDIEHDKDIACPCVYSRDDIREYGQCYCGLFLSKDFAASGKTPTVIPERRPDNKFPY